jgi:hypothetical protein
MLYFFLHDETTYRVIAKQHGKLPDLAKLPDFNIGSDHVEPDNHVQHIHSGVELEVSAKY